MNFLKKIFEKFTGKKEEKKHIQPQPDTVETKTVEEKSQEKKERKITEKNDDEIIAELNMLAPGIFSQAKTPEAKKMIIQIYRKMIEDGVNIENEKEVEKWMEKNQHLFAGDVPKVETYRREKPKIGRNDPCPCGSGKKYKKCCGSNE